jgi:hypothetical protein
MRALIFVILLSFATSVEARTHRHTHHHHVYGHESQHSLHVAVAYHDRFAGLAAEFSSMGYNIGTPGCMSNCHMRNSKHHWGGACDLFNQIARNRTALRQPPPSVQIAVAARHGLTSGCVWHSPDCGHFEVPTGGHASSHYAAIPHLRYAVFYKRHWRQHHRRLLWA